MSRLPVRAVTKPGDNKSDPNLETLTYGLFSTCSPRMRSGIVTRGSEYLFFATRRGDKRILTGYYRLRWYTNGVFVDKRDFALAADAARFIEKSISLTEVDRRCKTNVSRRFRGMLLLTPAECRKLKRLVDSQPDATAAYLEEVDRLERFNSKHGGYRYIAWRLKEKFSWELARQYLTEKRVAKTDTRLVLNSSPSGLWVCEVCNNVVTNKALLKRCPFCAKFGTLRPHTAKM